MNKILLLIPLCTGCLTLEDGEKIRAEIRDVKSTSAKNEMRAADLGKQLDEQLAKLKAAVEDARVATRNSADVGGKLDKVQMELAQLNSRVDEMQRASDAITKAFQDYRASSDTKLEQLTNQTTAAKAPPLPETADGVYAEGEKRLAAQQWQDARRVFGAFINRYPTDARAPKAQYSVAEAYFGEKRFANAIREYRAIIDTYPKSDLVPEAMYKSGQAYYALKYCDDAKTFFQELVKRYPKTNRKKDVADQLKKLTKDARNKDACTS
jgi:tol-pal system protein YbgF